MAPKQMLMPKKVGRTEKQTIFCPGRDAGSPGESTWAALRRHRLRHRRPDILRLAPTPWRRQKNPNRECLLEERQTQMRHLLASTGLRTTTVATKVTKAHGGDEQLGAV